MAAVLCALLSTAAAFTATPFAAGGGVRMACARRHRPPLAKADDEFGALAAEVRQYLSTLDEAATSQGRAVRAAWLLALVFGVVRFLQFVGELEHAVPAAEESSSGFGSFFGRGKEL